MHRSTLIALIVTCGLLLAVMGIALAVYCNVSPVVVADIVVGSAFLAFIVLLAYIVFFFQPSHPSGYRRSKKRMEREVEKLLEEGLKG